MNRSNIRSQSWDGYWVEMACQPERPSSFGLGTTKPDPMCKRWFKGGGPCRAKCFLIATQPKLAHLKPNLAQPIRKNLTNQRTGTVRRPCPIFLKKKKKEALGGGIRCMVDFWRSNVQIVLLLDLS